MASYLRPCVALAPWSPENLGPFGPFNYELFHNRDFYNDSRTSFARFWIRWDHLQPYEAYSNTTADGRPIPGYGGAGLSPQAYLYYMASNIQKARQDGRRIVLTLYATPSWANASRRASGPRPAGASDFYCPPDSAAAGTASSFGSPYDFIISSLALWFHTQAPRNPWFPGAAVDFLEVVNEPNLQWWPQTNYSGQKLMPFTAAAMMATARTRTRLSFGNYPIIAGPAVVDTQRNEPTITDWLSTTNEILFWLSATTVDQFLAWTIHNYGDVRDGTNLASSAVGRLRAANWRGWPYADVNDPYLLATEGGYRHTGAPPTAAQEQVQADRLESTWTRYRAAPGVGMMTNYLMWSVPTYDTGLCDQVTQSYDPSAPASAYERRAVATWRDLPTTAPR